MIKVIKTHYDNSNVKRKDILKEVIYYIDLKTALKNIRNQIIELENSGKENYWCIKNNEKIFFWDGEHQKDYTIWNIEKCD